MNVTVKLDQKLYISARHRAVDDGLSLSAWLAKLIDREIGGASSVDSDNLLDCLGDERLAERDLPLDISSDPPKDIQW